MTRKELNTYIEKRYSECCKRSQGLSYGSFYDGYVDCYCEQQKRIEKLEQQIEKMKCCENCAFFKDKTYDICQRIKKFGIRKCAFYKMM